MKRLIIALLVLGLEPALSQEWIGRYAHDPGDCQYPDGATTYRWNSIEYFEIGCRIEGTEKLHGLDAWRMVVSCSGEGSEFPPRVELVMLTDEGLAIYTNDADTGAPQIDRLKRCETE